MTIYALALIAALRRRIDVHYLTTTLLSTSCMAGNMDFIGRPLAPYLAQKLSLPGQLRRRHPLAGAGAALRSGDDPHRLDLRPAIYPESGRSRCAYRPPGRAGDGRRALRRPSRSIFRTSWCAGTAPTGSLTICAARPGATTNPIPIPATRRSAITWPARHEGGDFFGRVIESGSHETSLQMILDGAIDGSAIDSTVLELETRAPPYPGGRDPRPGHHRPQPHPALAG